MAVSLSFGLYLLYLALAYLRPIEAFAPELVEYRPMLVLSLLTLAVSVGSAIVRRTVAARPQHLWLLLGFVAAIAMSHLSAGRFGIALDSFIDFMPSVVLFVTTVTNVTDLRRLRLTCAVVVVCTSLLGIASIAAYHTGFLADKLLLRESPESSEQPSEPSEPATSPAEDVSGAYLWRVQSLGYLSDPNDFAQAIVVSLPLLAALLARTRPLRSLVGVGIPGATLLYTIYLTHSRGALLGLGSLFLAGARRMVGIRWTAVLLVAGIGAAVAVGFTGGRAYTANEESAGGRIDAWNAGLSMLASHPLFGVGYHFFTEYHALTAHNSFVLCAAETGLVGYVLWLGMLVVVLKDLSVAIRAGGDPDAVRWANALRASLVGFLTCALFLSRAYEPLIYQTLGLCVSASYCATRAAQPGPARDPARPTRWLGASLTVAFISIVAIRLFVFLMDAM